MRIKKMIAKGKMVSFKNSPNKNNKEMYKDQSGEIMCILIWGLEGNTKPSFSLSLLVKETLPNCYSSKISQSCFPGVVLPLPLYPTPPHPKQ